MAGFSSSRPNAPITGINVTPLVDITLVLLIIFMVTAKLVVSRALPLDLPKAATGGEVQCILAVSIAPSGELSVDGRSTDGRGLIAQARESLAKHPDLRSVIDADGQVPHRRVMETLDYLRQAGVTKVAFGVNPTQALSTDAAAEHDDAAKLEPRP